MLVIKQLLIPIDLHSIAFPSLEVNRDHQLFGSSTFFKISSFMFDARKRTLLLERECTRLLS